MSGIPNTIAPFCGWGERGTTDFIPFSVLRDDSMGTLPGWASAPNLAIEPVPGSDRIIVQNMGMGPATITLRLWFDDPADYDRFYSVQGTVGTLTVVRGTQSLVGTDEYVQGMAYTHLDNVYLTGISDEKRYPGNGPVECSASFLRAVNRLTRQAVS